MRYFILFLGILLFSCNKKENLTTNISIKKDSILVEEKEDLRFTNKASIQKLHAEAIKIMDDWQEYQSVAAFIQKFQKTSTKEILLNSNQFYELTTYLKDSIRLQRFKEPSVKIRLNVLNNEALRLFDMDSIPSITNKEVIKETEKIINAFNALNSKINSVVKRDLLTNSLTEVAPVFEEDKELSKITKKVVASKSKLREDKKKSFKNLKIDKSFLKNKRIKPLPKKKQATVSLKKP